MDDCSAGRASVADRHRERVCDQRRGLVAVDRPAHYLFSSERPGQRSSTPSFPGRVLGDVGQPELVRRPASEVTADQVGRASRTLTRFFRPFRVGSPLSCSLAHQLVHELLRDADLPAELQLRPDTAIAVHAPRSGVDLARSAPAATADAAQRPREGPSASRNSHWGRLRASGSSASPHSPARPEQRSPGTSFWANRALHEQRRGLFDDRQLCLELPDPPPRLAASSTRSRLDGPDHSPRSTRSWAFHR